MAKKSTHTEIAALTPESETMGKSQCANVRTFDRMAFDESDAQAVAQLGLVVGGSIDNQLTRAVTNYNQAARLTVEAGYLLLNIKSQIDNGGFIERIEQMGLSRFRAAEMMRMAKFVSAIPIEQRWEMIDLPKTKLIALASADKEVVEDLLENGTDDIKDLSVRALRCRIHDLEASNTNLTVERDTANAELATARKKLNAPEDRQDSVPVVIADLRSEIVALGKKASLAVDGFNPLGRDIVNLLGSDAAYMWADATLRLALAQLAAIGLQVEGLLKSFKDALGDDGASAVEMSYLSGQEVVEAAQKFKELIAEHEHEAALRAWEREQERPRDKGRPRSKPEAPAKSRKG